MFIFHNKIVLVSGINAMCKLFQQPNSLCNSPTIPSFPSLYSDRIAIKHSMSTDTLHMIRLWKTKSVFDLWYDDFNTRNFVGALDYEVHADHINIEYMSINEPTENNRDKMYKKILDQNNDVITAEESDELIHAMLHFMKNVAKEEKKSKIVVDVHHNLRIFNKYYQEEGFNVTDRKCSDNPYWIETEYDVVRP
jgi:hypothetical protein